MGLVHIPDNKDIELTSLEAHVRMCQQRHASLIERIARVEAKVDDIITQTTANRRLIIGWIITISTSVIGGAITLITKFSLH